VYAWVPDPILPVPHEKMPYETSTAYMALIFTITIIASWWAELVITALCIMIRKGPYSYGMGKVPTRGSERPMRGDAHFWYRWLRAPEGWLPIWAWMLILFIVAGCWGAGWGVHMWIVNDYLTTNTSGIFWTVIASFYIIVPVLHTFWAGMFFYRQWLGAAVFCAVLYFAAVGVQFGMTLSYPVVYLNSLFVYQQYQWTSFGLGGCVQLLWAFYVLIVTVIVYVRNKDRTDDELAPDEDEVEAQAMAALHAGDLATIKANSILTADALMAPLQGRIVRRRVTSARV